MTEMDIPRSPKSDNEIELKPIDTPETIEQAKLLEKDRLNRVNRSSGSWFVDMVIKRLTEHRPANMVFLGETGSGKSAAAIRLAYNIDPFFSLDRIVFSVADFMKLINSGLARGSAIIFDDAGVGISNRDWQQEQSKIFGKVSQTVRHRDYLIIFTLPDRSFLEKQSRNLIQFEFSATAERGLFKVLKIIPSRIRNMTESWGIIMKKMYYRNDGLPIVVVHKYIRFAMPPTRIFEPYEEMKALWLSKFYNESEKSTEHDPLAKANLNKNNSQKQDEEEPEKEVVVPDGMEYGVRLKCGNDDCNHAFQYTQKKNIVRCPECNRQIIVPYQLMNYLAKVHKPIKYKY